MDLQQPETDVRLALTAKAIADLDSTVSALVKILPPAKAWQRQLRAFLLEADRSMQVLRLTVAMDRSGSERQDAGKSLLFALRAADMLVGRSRADVDIKGAVRMAHALAQQVQRGLVELG